MMPLAMSLVAVACGVVAGYCVTLLNRSALYKARWLAAIGLVGVLDEELREALDREEALACLANALGAKPEVRVEHAAAIHDAMRQELDFARSQRAAARRKREEEGWETLSRTR